MTEDGEIKFEVKFSTWGAGVNEFRVDVSVKGTHIVRFYSNDPIGSLTRQALKSPERFKIRKEFLDDFVNRIESAFELKDRDSKL